MVKTGMDYISKSKASDYKDKPMYALLHLATFKVKNENESKNAKAKMQLLIELDKNAGIWPLKMFMCFSGQWLVLLDNNKMEIENFPGSLIKEPTAFVSEDELEVFNNILMFTVPGIALGISEMHIFQAIDVSAVHLVEDLNLLSSGNIVQIDQNRTPFNAAKKEYTVHQKYEYINFKEEDFEERQQYQRNVLVANHCFEDIERFVARLQFAAEAIQELERNQHVHSTHGEGLLILRSRPPLENEFHDIMAKHKLALNYIVKLQHNFKDVADVTHNILTSLRTVVDVCRVIYVDAMIPENVVNPLLRRETINFLNSCLNRQEIEFWKSLGQNWVLPKDQFKNHKGSYHPIFYDDWSPDWNVDEPVDYVPIALKKATSVYEEKTQESWLARLETRNVRIGQVINNRMCQNDKELEVYKGEYLEIIDGSRNWWKARNSVGRIGFVPNTIITEQRFEPRTKKLSVYTKDLEQNNTAEQTAQSEATRNFPRSYSMPNVPAPPPLPQSEEIKTNSLRQTLDQESFAGGSIVAMRPRNNFDSTTEALNEELRFNLKQRERRRDLEILTTPQIYINQNSSSSEVEEWLRAKGFSDGIVRKLKALNGEELFALSPQAIEGYFGQKDSRRLISQIVLQKNISEFKSVRSTELSKKLERVRQKIEESDNSNNFNS